MGKTWQQRAARRLQALRDIKYTEALRETNERIEEISEANPDMGGNDVRLKLNEELDQIILSES